MNRIYFLSEYNWECGTLISVGPKNYKILVDIPGFIIHTRYIPKNKCARPDDKVCVVWERWKGRNGRGGYRVERELYIDYRISADQIARQNLGPGRVIEAAPGILHQDA